MYVSVLEMGLGGALGVNGGWMPLHTRSQGYCDYRPTEPSIRTVFTVRITLPAPSLNPESSVISRSPNSVGQKTEV